VVFAAVSCWPCGGDSTAQPEQTKAIIEEMKANFISDIPLCFKDGE
jgi:hypothetical protein